MRLLLIGINYAPEETGIAPYTTGFAEHLASRGHAVTVVTGLPSYPQWRVHDGYQRVAWRRELIRGVDVRRRWHYVPRAQSALHRGVYEATFLLTGLSALALRRPDVVLGIVPSVGGGLLARLAARRFGAPYGLIFQDLIGRAAAQTGVPGASRVAGAIQAAERWAACGAAAVGIIAEGFRLYLGSLGVDPGRIERVRNWTHVDPPALERAAVRQQLGLPAEAVICLHAGNMGYKQGLATVIECAHLATASAPRLLFVLMGDGNQRTLLERLAATYRLTNVRFLPIQPRDFFPSVLAAADLLLLTQRASVDDMALPGKLTSYFASGRPVVAAVALASETAREVQAAEGGVLVTPDEPEALLAALRALAADPARQARLGANGAAYAREALSAEGTLAGLEMFADRVAALARVPHFRLAL